MINKTQLPAESSIQPLTVKSSVIFYGLSMIASLFNFLYYPVMARLVPANTYGEIQFLVTLLFQVSIIFMALNVITIILSIKYRQSAPVLKNKIAMLSTLFNLITLVCTIIFTLILAFGGGLLRFDSPASFFMLGVAALSTVPFTVGIGKLQGQERYVDAGIMNAAGSLIKLVASIILVLVGLKTPGAILGIAIGQIGAVVIAIALGKLVFSELFSLNLRQLSALIVDRKLIIIVGICVIVVNLLSIADTVVAKILLSPHDAGLYAGIATLAKIAIYVVSPLMWMLIPAAANTYAQHDRVKKLFVIAAFFCALLIIGYWLFTSQIINIVVGENFLQMRQLLVYATIAMSLLALSTMLNIILAARGYYHDLIIQTVIMVIPIALIALFAQHLSIHQILTAQLVSGSAGMIYYYIAYLLKRK